jgi:hypothetical protein
MPGRLLGRGFAESYLIFKLVKLALAQPLDCNE